MREESIRQRLTYPALNPSFVPVRVDRNTIHIRASPWTGPAMTVRETDGDEELEELFALLDGKRTVEEILAEFDEEDHDAILTLFERMVERKILYDAAEYDRVGWPQLALSPKCSDRNYSRLESGSVLVVSDGTIGPQIALDLDRAGVGDVALFPTEGETAETARLRDWESVTVLDGADVDATVAESEYVVLALDAERPRLAARVNAVAHEASTPWTLVQRRGFDGLVGPTVFPGETSCYECLERRIAANLSDTKEYVAYRNQFADDESFAGVGLPAYGRMLAGYATIDVLHLLAYGQAFTAGRTITVNFLDLSTEVNDVLKLPRCSVCGADPDDVQRFVGIDDVVEATDLAERNGGS